MLERIISEIEKKALETDPMDLEDVNISLKITDAEKKEFLKESNQLNDHYFWQFDGDELFVSYMVEI